MKRQIVPTAEFDSIFDITPEVLSEYGVRCLLTDLDSTIVPHGEVDPSDEVVAWFKRLEDARIPVCIISNNSYNRVLPFAEVVGVGFFSRAFKPSVRYAKRALEIMDVEATEAAFIGDQMFTDIKCACNLGIKSFLVKPVGTKTTFFIKIKRIFEARMREGK